MTVPQAAEDRDHAIVEGALAEPVRTAGEVAQRLDGVRHPRLGRPDAMNVEALEKLRRDRRDEAAILSRQFRFKGPQILQVGRHPEPPR